MNFYKKHKTCVIFSALFIGCALILCWVYFFFPRVIVFGSSMLPTYENGQFLDATDEFDSLDRYDVIVFRNGEKNLIKRVIGVPGDTVQIREDGIYINGTVINDRFGVPDDFGIAADEIALSANEYFVLGDNRNNSRDSRAFGPVKADSIMYKVIGSSAFNNSWIMRLVRTI